MVKFLIRWGVVMVLVGLLAAPLGAVPRIGEYGQIIHDGTGKIERIGNDGKIVIGDQLFTFSTHAVFYNAVGAPVTFSFFKVGTRVAYDLNNDGRIVALYEK